MSNLVHLLSRRLRVRLLGAAFGNDVDVSELHAWADSLGLT